MKFSLDENQKFWLNIILAIIGLVTIDRIIRLFTKTFDMLLWVNDTVFQYGGLILLILLIMGCYLIYKIKIINQKVGLLDLKVITIYSDESTIFIGSNTNRALPANVKAISTWVHQNWKTADRLYPQLGKAIWLGERKNITNQEALEGGQYTFCKEFDINFEPSKIRSATLFLLVDDFCELSVNENRFEKVGGYMELHEFDISRALQKGKNRVQFVIENTAAKQFNDPTINKDFFEAKEKFLWNPYGFKFNLIIQYLK